MFYELVNGLLGYKMGKLAKKQTEAVSLQASTVYDVIATLGSYDKIACEGTENDMDTIRTMISMPEHRDVLWIVADAPIVFGNTTAGMIQTGEVIYDPPINRPAAPIKATAIGLDFAVIDDVCHVRRLIKKFDNVSYVERR